MVQSSAYVHDNKDERILLKKAQGHSHTWATVHVVHSCPTLGKTNFIYIYIYIYVGAKT